MLSSLTVSDIVLIDSLELRLAPGLCVLTGETGAGKSILLDALGFAIGGRGERGLVRLGAAQGLVTAVFELAPQHAAWSYLAEQGLKADREEGQLILRRIISEDGRSRAFVNDQPVSITLLGQLGDLLVEVHGQQDDRGLFNPQGHRQLLDSFGGLDADIKALAAAYQAFKALTEAASDEKHKLGQAKADEEYVRHNLEELKSLNPELGEEAELAERRSFMMQGEKLSDSLNDILASLGLEGGIDATLRGALRKAERLAEKLGERAESAIDALERASTETSEAIGQLEDLARQISFNPKELETAEERLFALRACARKHRLSVDDLAALKADFEEKLAALDHSEAELVRLDALSRVARAAYESLVNKLSEKRRAAALKLDALVNAELASLKLEKAKFRTRLDPLAPDLWGAEGGDKIEFEVSTNPGAPFGALQKIASGGELSRFILALKVVLARQGSATTLVFDEIDRGIGGAVADAVGERLARLALEAQVLVVTHSPQVASLGRHHWQISKSAGLGKDAVTDKLITRVTPLDKAERREEIARMLAGAHITDEARAAADKLLERQIS
jgi:DNA repair protein RecN (Recombination protein N)